MCYDNLLWGHVMVPCGEDYGFPAIPIIVRPRDSGSVRYVEAGYDVDCAHMSHLSRALIICHLRSHTCTPVS